jgi:hypothetical protein
MRAAVDSRVALLTTITAGSRHGRAEILLPGLPGARRERSRAASAFSPRWTVIPWKRLIGLIEPHSVKPGKGRRPLGLEKMLRIYFLQQWLDLSDPAVEDAIDDSESMRRFVGVGLGEDVVPTSRRSFAPGISWRSTSSPEKSARRSAL